MAQLKHNTPADQVLELLTEQGTHGLAEGDATSFDLPLTIHNAYQRLPIKIEDIQLQRESYSSKEVLCELEGNWKDTVLEPGQQRHGRIKGLLYTQAPPLHIGKARQSFHATFNFVPVVRFQNEAPLDESDKDSIQPLANTSSLTVDLHTSYGISYFSFAGLILILATGLAITTTKLKRAKQGRDEIRRRHGERKCLAGTLKIWPAERDEPEDHAVDLRARQNEKLDLAIANSSELEITAEDAPSGDVVARLTGHLIGASPDAESGRPESHVEIAGGHSLSYQSSEQMIPAASLVLSANDLIEIDGKWRLRYINHRLRTRAEMESAQNSGDLIQALITNREIGQELVTAAYSQDRPDHTRFSSELWARLDAFWLRRAVKLRDSTGGE